MIGGGAKFTINADVMLSRYDGPTAFGIRLAGWPDLRVMQEV